MKNILYLHKNGFLFFSGVLLIIVLGVSIFLIAHADTPTPSNRFLEKLHQEQTQVANPSLNSEYQTSIAFDMRENSWFLTQIAKAQTTPKSLRAQASPPTSFPMPTPQPYIAEGDSGLFHSNQAKIQNQWLGYQQGVMVRVFAGTGPQDPEQGIIIVNIHANDGNGNPYYHVFEIPEKTGSVRIVSEQNNRLTLQAEGGQDYYFDVPGLAFADSLSAPVTPVFDQFLQETPSPQRALPALSTPEPAYP